MKNLIIIAFLCLTSTIFSQVTLSKYDNDSNLLSKNTTEGEMSWDIDQEQSILWEITTTELGEVKYVPFNIKEFKSSNKLVVDIPSGEWFTIEFIQGDKVKYQLNSMYYIYSGNINKL